MARLYGRPHSLAIGIAVFAVGTAAAVAGILLAFVLSDQDAYGELPIPGSTRLHLPAGEVDVTFRTDAHAEEEPPPPMTLRVVGPDGIPRPEVLEAGRVMDPTEGPTVRRVWVVRLAQDADYDVNTAGVVDVADNPRLAFGRNIWNSPLQLLLGLGYLVGAPLAVGSLAGIIGEVRARRAGRRAPAALLADSPPSPPYVPTSDAAQAEQLKHIAALRDSGALTDKEYVAEKRRIEKG
jgi:hypothetical protein